MHRRTLSIVMAGAILTGAMLTIPAVQILLAQSGGPIQLHLPLIANGAVPDATPTPIQTPGPGSKIRLVAQADAYVFEAGPDTNRGAEQYMIVGYDEDEETRERTTRGLVRFAAPSSSASPVEVATLRIYYGGYSDYPDMIRLTTAYGVAEPWQELVVTWANRPGLGEQYGSVSTAANDASVDSYQEIDITTLVQEWLDGSTPNNGIYLLGPEMSGSDYSYRVFAARESAHPPELVIEYQ